MGRGLSDRQRQILDVLPFLEPIEGSVDLASAMRPVDLLKALGLPLANSTRASISRSLSLLWRRGLITIWKPDENLQGGGYRYTRPR